MHLDPFRGQPVDLLHDLPRLGILHHPDAHFGVRRVHRDVERREPLVDDALEFRLGEIREGDEVPVDEREDVVVVLDQELAPHSLGVLVDEAEDAVVVAALGLARLEFRPEGNPVLPPSLDLPLRALRVQDAHAEDLLGRLRGEIDLVVQEDVVDGQNALASPDAQPEGQAVRVEIGHGKGITETDHGGSSGKRDGSKER